MSETRLLPLLGDVAQALSRHKKKAVSVFLLAVGTATLAAFLLPKSYRSEAKLFVRLGRENATLDTTVSPGREPVVAIPMSRENEINSLVEVLRSRAMLEKVVDGIGSQAILQPPAEPTPNRLDAPGAVASRQKQSNNETPNAESLVSLPAEHEKAIQMLQQRVSVVPTRNSTVIGVICMGPSPQWAQRIVDELVELYLAEHIRLNRSEGSLDFFAAQMVQLRQELMDKELKLRDVKSATGIASPIDQQKAIVQQITELHDEMALAERGFAVSCEKVQQLQSQLNNLPEKQVTSSTEGLPNEGTDLMRNELYRLRLQREAAAAKYTQNHPMMHQAEEQLAEAQRVINQQEASRTQVTTANSRPYEETRLSLLKEQSEMASWQTKKSTLATQLADAQRDLREFNKNELTIAQLQRDVDLARTNYQAYAASAERARIDLALENQHMSNISVVQPATYETKPIGPRKAVILGLGLISGMLGAFTMALLCDFFDRRFHTPEDVEERLDMSVLGSVPRLRPEELILTGNGCS